MQDARRQNNVTKLVGMFEKHQLKEQFLKDMSQKQEINKFSEISQQSIVDMNQTEIFELCENSAKHRCLDCNAFSEIGIIYCSCGRNLKYSRSPTTLQKTNCDFTSIPGFVIKKNTSRGPKHGASERQVMFYRMTQMLKKARHGKHGNHPTTFQGGANKKNTESHWRSTILAKREWVMLFDRIALERHDFSATKAERLQHAKHWILRLNADGSQKPLRQRPQFSVALKQCLKMQDAHLAETRRSLRPIRPEHQQRQRDDQQFEGGENCDYYIDRKIGWRYYRGPRENPSAACSSSTTQWQHSQWQTSWSSWYSQLINGGDFGFLEGIPENRQGCRQDPLTKHMCAVQFDHSAHRTLNALGLASISVPQNQFGHLVCHMSHTWLFSHALSSMSTSSFHLPIQPHNKNAQYIHHISKLIQSTSCAIKNHSGVKTCRMAENSRTTTHTETTCLMF